MKLLSQTFLFMLFFFLSTRAPLHYLFYQLTHRVQKHNELRFNSVACSIPTDKWSEKCWGEQNKNSEPELMYIEQWGLKNLVCKVLKPMINSVKILSEWVWPNWSIQWPYRYYWKTHVHLGRDLGIALRSTWTAFLSPQHFEVMLVKKHQLSTKHQIRYLETFPLILTNNSSKWMLLRFILQATNEVQGDQVSCLSTKDS